MTTTTYNVGDKVCVAHPKYPGIWTVKKVDKVNLVLEPDNGGRPLRCSPSLLTDPGGEPVTDSPTVYYNPGELVRVTTGKFAGLYVVIADKGGDKVNLARLGGDGGRYLRAIRHGLVKVNPEEVLS